jgi:hypothetical protein
MKIMKKLTSLIHILFVILTLNSITAQSKSEILLNEVSKKMAQFDNMYIKFNYVLENQEVDLKQEVSGTVYTKGEKYNLEFMGNTFIYDTQNTYIILPEEEEINIINGNSDEAMLNPSKLLFFYKKGFTYTWSNIKKINEKKIQYIKLIPMDSDSETSYFILGINVDSKIIHSIKEVGKNNTTTTFNIEEFHPNQNLSENLFIFDKAKFEQQQYTINR